MGLDRTSLQFDRNDHAIYQVVDSGEKISVHESQPDSAPSSYDGLGVRASVQCNLKECM